MTFPFPTFMPAEAGGISSIVQQASATSTASTITWPSVAAGDIAVMFDAGGGFSPPTSVTPSGFTKMCEISSSFWRGIVSFKRCVGTESGSLTGMNATITNKKIMVTFRATPATASATHGGAQNGTFTDGNPGSITVASGSGSPPLIVVGAYQSDGTINPRTFTVGGAAAKDGEVANGTTMYLAWKIYLASPADVVIDMDDEGAQNLVQGAYIQVS